MKNINFSLFFKANLFLTIGLFLLFLQYENNYSLLSFLMIFISSISSAIILYILVYILLFIFTFTNKFIIYLSSLIFVSINIGLVIDFFIFKLYKFHINAMVLNILLSPDAMDSIQLGIFPILLFVGIVLGFIVFEIYLILKLSLLTDEYKNSLNIKLNRYITIPFILIILTEKILYGFASLTNKNKIVSKFKVIPLYQPLTFGKLAFKYFDYKPDVQVQNTISKKATLNYPIKPLTIRKNSNKINIIIIASDAVRNSIINKEVTPHIEAFKKDAIVFKHHYSGGNATRFGIFSLMYGINSTYWFSFLHANKGPVLFDVLNKLGYNIDIISSTNTSWPEFRKTCYVDILDSIKDDFTGSPWQKDKQSTEYFLDKIKNYTDNKPIFSFVFLDAPHGYSYPKEFDIFKAGGENINYLTATKGSSEIKNAFARYKNSVAYNDKLFKDIINKLKEKGLYDNSLIIYTADHGQEFYEYGSFGHNSSFSKAQTHIPLIVKLPKSMHNDLTVNNTNSLTSHNDIVSTILSMIGVTNKSTDYSNGYNLFDKDFSRDFVFSANWNNNAIITKDKIYVFSNMPNKIFQNEVRDANTYNKLENEKVNSKKVLEIMNENRMFSQ